MLSLSPKVFSDIIHRYRRYLVKVLSLNNLEAKLPTPYGVKDCRHLRCKGSRAPPETILSVLSLKMNLNYNL